VLVARDGSSELLDWSARPVLPGAGDVVVSILSTAELLVVDPGRRTVRPLRTQMFNTTRHVVDPVRGTVWGWALQQVLGRPEQLVGAVPGNGHRTSHPFGVPGPRGGPLAARDGHVAAVLGRPVGASDAVRVVRLWLSADDGRSWQKVPAGDLPFRTVASLVTPSDGSLAVLDTHGQVWRSTDASWRAFARVASDVEGVTAVGDSLVVLHDDGVAETLGPAGTVNGSVDTGW
jgi:hypothetical protein